MFPQSVLPGSWRLRTRVLAGFAAVMSLLLAASAVGIVRIGHLSERLEHLVEVEVRALELSRVWAASSEANIQRRVVALAVDDEAFIKAFTRRIPEVSKKVDGVQKELEALPKSPAAEALTTRIAEARKSYQVLRAELYKLKEGGNDIRVRVTGEMIPVMEAYVDTVAGYAELAREQLQRHKEVAQSDARRTRGLIITMLVLAALLGVAIALVITRSVTQPVARAGQFSERIASGDLAGQAPPAGADELGDLTRTLQRMQHQLGQTIAGIRQSAEQVRVASGEIASGNADLSNRTEQAAANLEQTGAAMRQLAEGVQVNVAAARQADALARAAAEVADRGGAMVGRVVQTMGGIQRASASIADITGLIDGIAFQTNILALNAAVEAARAGEQGRGFAVVAGEVRTLAQRAAAAAREIKTLISDSQQQVEGGSQLVEEAGATIGEVVQSVQRVTHVVAEISNATAAQALTLGEVGQAVYQLDQLTQQNAALVEQSAAAAQSLREQAEQLAGSVARFRLPVDA